MKESVVSACTNAVSGVSKNCLLRVFSETKAAAAATDKWAQGDAF